MRMVMVVMACAGLSACMTVEQTPHLKEGRYLVTLDSPPGILSQADLQDQAQRTAQEYCAWKAAGSTAVPASDDPGAAGWTPAANQAVFKCVAVLPPG
jgi:hypothetical protein